MALLFLASGLGELSAISATQGYMRAYGVPAEFVWPAAAFGISSDDLLLAGLWLRPLALLFAEGCLLTAAIVHTAFADPIQQIMFFKNMTMASGFLLLARTGVPEFRP